MHFLQVFEILRSAGLSWWVGPTERPVRTPLIFPPLKLTQTDNDFSCWDVKAHFLMFSQPNF